MVWMRIVGVRFESIVSLVIKAGKTEASEITCGLTVGPPRCHRVQDAIHVGLGSHTRPAL